MKKEIKLSDMLIFGKHPTLSALQNPNRRCHELWVTQSTLNTIGYNNLKLLVKAKHIDFKIVENKDIEKLIGQETVHQGILLRVSPLETPDLISVLATAAQKPFSLIVLLDQVTDPHNVGAILRSAAAFDAEAVVTTTLHSPQESTTLAKSASGALEAIPFIKITNLVTTLKLMKDHGFWIIGLDGHTSTTLESVPNYTHMGLILGAEGQGMRSLTKQHCDLIVKLPITSKVESLNVSNAAAISLYSLTRRNFA